MTRLHQAIVTLLIGTLLGCGDVKLADLSGTWVMRDNSRSVLPTESQHAAATIVLNSDGTFAASDVPALFFFPGQREARLESGKGTWQLIGSGSNQEVRLTFAEISDWTKGLPYGAQLSVDKGLSFDQLVLFRRGPR